MPNIQIPSPQEANDRYMVNMPNALKGNLWPLYDIQTYPAAGARKLTFFAEQLGANGRTLNDTNMEAAGSLPGQQWYFCKYISVAFFHNNQLMDMVAATTTSQDVVNDTNNVLKAGSLNLTVVGTSFAQVAPLMMAPPPARLVVNSAVATTVAAQDSAGAYAAACGDLYDTGGLFIPPTQPFKVEIEFDQPIPIDADSRIGVYMWGALYRPIN